jgi:hypothetical protein
MELATMPAYQVGRKTVFDRYMKCSKCDSWISRETPDIYKTAGGQPRHNRCGGRIRNKSRSN